MNGRWLNATQCNSNSTLSAEQVRQWQSEGFTFVRGLLPDVDVCSLVETISGIFPAAGTESAEKIADFGSEGALCFPSRVKAFNQITLHQNLLQSIATLLEEQVSDLRLTQSDLWPKYGRVTKRGDQDHSDQRIHVDYPNHSLVHPTPWHKPEAVELILYLSDSDQTGGATAVVARNGLDDPAYRWPIVDSPGIGELPYINDRDAAERHFSLKKPELSLWRESLYEREQYVRFKQGDILFYRHDTWHRGTAMKPGALRLAHNMTFRKAASEWLSTLHIGWAWSAYDDDKFFEKLIASSTLAQRAVMGFPQPGSAYWCKETLEAVQARYGMFGFDIAPYLEALQISDIKAGTSEENR